MRTSANKNDCMFHSLLQGVSPLFRRLLQNNKDRVADYVRRLLFPKFTQFNEVNGLQTESSIDSTVFQKIGKLLKIGIFYIDKHLNNSKPNEYILYDIDAGIAVPGIEDKIPYERAVVIYNPGQNHWETVLCDGKYQLDSNGIKICREIIFNQFKDETEYNLRLLIVRVLDENPGLSDHPDAVVLITAMIKNVPEIKKYTIDIKRLITEIINLYS
jgi:hypothetical protein